METWEQSRKAINGDLKRHGKQIGELYGKVDDVDERVGKVEIDLGAKMSSVETKLDLLHNYSRAIILSAFGGLVALIVALLTAP